VAAPAAVEDDPNAWNALVASAKRAAVAAKRTNVVLAVRDVPGTLCANVADARQLLKEVDSSWLRHALDVAAVNPSDPLEAALRKTVIAVHASPPGDAGTLRAAVAALVGFRGFLVVDLVAAGATAGDLAGLLSQARNSE